MTCDVCVIGAGAAGIALALELESQGRSVLLLEAGRRRNAGPAQALYQGTLNDPQRHLPLDQARYRQLGGTTALWGGRCLPYDGIDFESRPWVPHSGWPLTRAELDPWYARAHHYLECGAFDYRAASALGTTAGEMVPGFRDGAIDTGSLERWSPPTHFGKVYHDALKKSSRVQVMLDAVATALHTDDSGSSVTAIEVKHPSGTRGFRIQPHEVVLAGGGLETTRLLMTSRQGTRDGIGAASGWLGRGYMAHIHGVIARVRFRAGTPVISGYEQDAQGVYVRRRLWVSERAQRELELLNIYMLLDRPLLDDPSHGSAVLSAAFLAKKLFQRGRDENLGSGKYAIYWSHLRNILSGSPEVVSFLPPFARNRFLQKRRVPSMVVKAKSNEFHLYFQSEQVPHIDAGLRLADGRDALGQRQLHLDFRVQPQDTDSVWRVHQLVDRELRAQDRGELLFDDHAVEKLTQSKAVLGHHVGTTRMAGDPANGVVDADCRVHGLRNLHVASASVLPTSSHANPTLTVVALALRLAHSLSARSAGAAGS
ncbi:FAD-dependent oxidoreductase [Accumulibacter sp.]|uniref:FAD-dependent oxidoreductase n=1 Tax=Accumulibacter sp. TaxID=2053492 RepID=UPI0025D22F0D|nr:FAD-dependent oxidoreductase [Accumulibacter sp.]MCP5229431.1 GMC family oxidoreductase [Accumulibacter sp.]